MSNENFELRKGWTDFDADFVGVVEAIRKFLFAVRSTSQLAYNRPVGQKYNKTYIYIRDYMSMY